MTGARLWRTLIAVGLAWCLPGLGHVFLGRIRRGVLFAVLYRYRSLAIAVYTHALYDIYVMLIR